MKKLFQLGSALGLAFALAACGGGGGGNGGSSDNSQSSPAPQSNPQQPTQSTTANTVPVTVNSQSFYFNSPRVSVTVCQSGTSNCATIPNIIVDTGSIGLRLFKSALPATLALTPEVNSATHDPVGECAVFASGPAWGPLATADIQMAGERASAVPIQLIDATFASAPASCANQGALQTADIQKANGILGVANFLQDSGAYFDCSGSSCNAYGVSAAQKVVNPVSKFATDNNGIVLSFPGLATGLSAEAVGTLTFGINTQADNADSNVSMSAGVSNGMSTTVSGKSTMAIIDSGSGVDYLGSASMPTCPLVGYTWYCPSSTMSFSAAFTGGTGNALNVAYAVANAQAVLTSPAVNGAYAIANLAVQEDLLGEPTLDLGMSYLYGHTLFLQFPDSTGVSKIGVANI
ncbi:DUF3443 family protein [Paraburkholderia flagellata]|uniref:DUF3443 family protein n=1 Tax=Paraburkholderia flagellata TaxID=2883241 RepID=UPI001F39B522|nr:DUF3443 family protein [Paraburkholderia flagellata]